MSIVVLTNAADQSKVAIDTEFISHIHPLMAGDYRVSRIHCVYGANAQMWKCFDVMETVDEIANLINDTDAMEN